MGRIVRWSEVEYQPDLVHPVAPVPLGLVLEEKRGGWRQVHIVGRMPRGVPPGGLPPELQLESAWGPFLDSLSSWVSIFGKSVDDYLRRAPPNATAVTMLARTWRLNLYVKQPQSVVVVHGKSLEAMARQMYFKYVGEQLRVPLGKVGVRPRKYAWANQSLQAVA
jgi:hypothetical protein